MSGGGGGGTQTTVNTTQLPEWVSRAAFQNTELAGKVAQRLPAPYTGNLVPGFTADQNAAFAQTRAAASAAQPAITSGINAANAAAAYRPGSVSANAIAPTAVRAGGYDAATIAGGPQAAAANLASRNITGQGYQANTVAGGPQASAANIGASRIAGGPQATAANIGASNVAAGSFLSGDIQRYLNPQTAAIENRALDTLDRQRRNALGQVGGQAASMGAFGGSRQAILEGVTNAESARAAGDMSATLRGQAFDRGAALMTADQNRALEAARANQAAGLQASQANQAAGLQAQGLNMDQWLKGALANQATALQAAQSNQAAGLQAQGLNLNQWLQGALANQAAGNRAAEFGATQGLEAARANQTAALDAGRANQAAGLQAQGMNMQQWLQTAQANQGATNRATEFGATQGLQASLANQAAALEAGKANQAAGLTAAQANQAAGLTANQQRVLAASQLGTLGQARQEAALQGAAALQSSGNQQQQLQAAQLAQKAANAEALRGYPIEQLNLRLQALGMAPYGQTTTSTGPSTQQRSNPFLTALGGAGTGAGIASALKLGGTAGAGVSGLGALLGLLSDETMKTDKERVGKDPQTGVPLYAYRYKGDPKSYPKVVGPMAQGVAKIAPGAVRRLPGREGKLAVNLGFPAMRKAFA